MSKSIKKYQKFAKSKSDYFKLSQQIVSFVYFTDAVMKVDRIKDFTTYLMLVIRIRKLRTTVAQQKIKIR